MHDLFFAIKYQPTIHTWMFCFHHFVQKYIPIDSIDKMLVYFIQLYEYKSHSSVLNICIDLL